MVFPRRVEGLRGVKDWVWRCGGGVGGQPGGSCKVVEDEMGAESEEVKKKWMVDGDEILVGVGVVAPLGSHFPSRML
jgi:hypothetical protein